MALIMLFAKESFGWCNSMGEYSKQEQIKVPLKQEENYKS